MPSYTLTPEQLKWSSRPKQKVSPTRLRECIIKQKGRCALSDAPLIFDKKEGTPEKGGQGCHPLYAAVDHIAPQSDELGFQLVCYDLNDLKGHLPPTLFAVLSKSSEWLKLMASWKKLAEERPSDRPAFRALIWAPEKELNQSPN